MSNALCRSEAKLRIFLVDDHSFILEGLKALIGAQPDMDVIGEAENGEMAVLKVADCLPDVVVMDVSMPRMGGMQATVQIRKSCPNVRVLALSMHEDTTYLRALLEAGASGYVLKRSASQELIQALRHVAAGATYVDPAIASKVTAAFVGTPSLRGEAAGMSLSEREEAVIRIVAQGYTNREIAERLDLSVKTVETYRARAMEKLGLASRADLVRFAAARDWLGDS